MAQDCNNSGTANNGPVALASFDALSPLEMKVNNLFELLRRCLRYEHERCAAEMMQRWHLIAVDWMELWRPDWPQSTIVTCLSVAGKSALEAAIALATQLRSEGFDAAWDVYGHDDL